VIDLRLRRVRGLLGGALLGLVVLAGVAWSTLRCRLVVYSQGIVERSGVVVAGPDWRWVVPPLSADDSRECTIATGAAEGRWEVALRGGKSGGETWFAPGPGRRLIVRILEDDAIELQVMKAWWE
jgi:hypothetical protein